MITVRKFDHWRHADALAATHRILDYGIHAREWRPDFVHYWHAYQRTEPPLTAGDVARMRNAWAHLALSYPGAFLKGRFLTFAGTMGGIPGVPLRITMMDDQIHLNDPKLGGRGQRLGIAPLTSKFEARVNKLVVQSMKLWSSWPGLLITVAVTGAALWSGALVTSVIGLAALGRAGLFFLLQPLDVLHYLYELQFFTFMLPLIFIAERRSGALPLWAEVRLPFTAALPWLARRRAPKHMVLALAGATLLGTAFAVSMMVPSGPSPSGPLPQAGMELVHSLNALEQRVGTLSREGCRFDEIDFSNSFDGDKGATRTGGRVPDPANRCQVFAAGKLDALLIPEGARISPPHPGAPAVGMVEFKLWSIPGQGSAEPDLVAVLPHVEPLICAYAAGPEAGPGVTGRIFYMDWTPSHFGAGAGPAPLPFAEAARGLRQFCLRGKQFDGREGERNTHLLRVLAAR